MTYPHNPAGAPQPRQGMSTGAKIAAFGCGIPVLLFVLLVGCGVVLTAGEDGAGDTSATESAPSPEAAEEEAPEEDVEEVAEEATEEEAPEEEGPATVSDGVHQVGADIEPGVYTTDGPDSGSIIPNCYYARLSGLSGEFEDIISNNNTEGAGTVEVSESDAALELSGGCEWTLQE